MSDPSEDCPSGFNLYQSNGLVVEVIHQLVAVFQQISLIIVSVILSFVIELSERLNRYCG